MALVFRCDGCGELEGGQKRNQFLTKHTGSIAYTPHDDNLRDNSESRHDLCSKCVTSFKAWLQSLLVKKEVEPQ